MGKSTPIEGTLSDVRVIMTIMRVLIVKSLCQVVMGWIPVLECLLPGVCWCMCLSPIISSMGFIIPLPFYARGNRVVSRCFGS
jgi:hypothetical protein